MKDSSSIGIDGNQSNNNAAESGAVYVFQRIGTIWQQQAYIKASNTNASDTFGRSIALNSDTLVVSADFEDGDSTGVNGDESSNLLEDSGAVYVYKRSGNSWEQQSYIKASNPDTEDFFGDPIALDGNNLVVGSYLEDSGATGINGDEMDNSVDASGAAYIFNLVAEDFTIQPGHSALWYNPEQNGHGINVYMLDNNGIIVIWYVYDDQGNQVWFLGIGSHDGTKATLDVSITDGAMFPPNFDPNDVNLTSWGQFELEFSGCNTGFFKWMPEAGNGFTAGEMNVSRLNNTLGLTCTE